MPPCCGDSDRPLHTLLPAHVGEVNTLDFLLYLGAWSQSDPLADWNGDGVIDTRDFLAYLNDWVAGC